MCKTAANRDRRRKKKFNKLNAEVRMTNVYLQCFDAVDWASGRASGL